MIRSTMIAGALAAAGAFGTPALAATCAHDTHLHHVARAADVPTRWSQAPHFIGVGPNGYWVTTNWGCWTDDGQGRIQDCNYGGGP
jgi:hypothetical protein